MDIVSIPELDYPDQICKKNPLSELPSPDLTQSSTGRGDVYLAGHDHDMQHLRPEGGLHFFVAGSGGANVRPMKVDPRSLFAKSSYGFAVIEGDSEQLKVTFVSPNLEQLYEYALTKKAQTAGNR